jgi:hypothetical protein
MRSGSRHRQSEEQGKGHGRPFAQLRNIGREQISVGGFDHDENAIKHRIGKAAFPERVNALLGILSRSTYPLAQQ